MHQTYRRVATPTRILVRLIYSTVQIALPWRKLPATDSRYLWSHVRTHSFREDPPGNDPGEIPPARRTRLRRRGYRSQGTVPRADHPHQAHSVAFRRHARGRTHPGRYPPGRQEAREGARARERMAPGLQHRRVRRADRPAPALPHPGRTPHGVASGINPTMAMLRVRAVITRRIPYGDTSWILHVFSREEGALSLMARGARRPKSPLAGALEPLGLSELEIMVKPGRDLQTLSPASALETRDGLRTALAAGAAAMVCAETVLRLVRAPGEHRGV